LHEFPLLKGRLINPINGLRGSKMSFFISNKAIVDKSSSYHLIHEFSDLEEIKESFPEIFSNMKMLRFLVKFNSLHKKRFFAIIDCFEKSKIFAKDIVLPSDLTVINPNQYLFNKISNKISVKILIRIDFRFISNKTFIK